jgi:hypothetical protein
MHDARDRRPRLRRVFDLLDSEARGWLGPEDFAALAALVDPTADGDAGRLAAAFAAADEDGDGRVTFDDVDRLSLAQASIFSFSLSFSLSHSLSLTHSHSLSFGSRPAVPRAGARADPTQQTTTQTQASRLIHTRVYRHAGARMQTERTHEDTRRTRAPAGPRAGESADPETRTLRDA